MRLQPIGLCYLKAALRRHVPGVEVVLRDYHHGWGRRTVPLPAELGFLKPYYFVSDKSPFSVFDQYYHFGASWEQIAADVRLLAPDMVGVSSLFSAYHQQALRCAEIVKRELGAVPVVLGGAHASALPERLMAHPAVDFVVRGEGERPLVELVRAWLGARCYEEVPNLVWRDGNRIAFNSRDENYGIDELPLPDLSDLPPQRYHCEGQPMCFVITSRGCPHRCAFCGVHETFGPRY